MEAIARIYNDIEDVHLTVCLVSDEKGEWFEIVCVVDDTGEVEDSTYGHSTRDGAITIAAAMYGWAWGWEEIENEN